MSRQLLSGLPVSLAILSAELQKVFAPDLESYANSVRRGRSPRGFKVINDPIWFTIRVEAWELVVLDSPLIQRLRDIHQLGLAGLVYPAAGYSRFEHTIGTLYQTQRIVESVNRNTRTRSAQTGRVLPEPVTRADEALLRLAAIVHDAGHCFLSHVSERAISRLPINDTISMDQGRSDAKKFFHCSHLPSVGEILSALIVLLPEFVEILEVAQIPYWRTKEAALADSLSKLVVRGRFPDRPFMNEIISGAVDADKMDYMPRDCYMAGLAMPIDVERLLEKLCVVNVPAAQITDEVGYKEMFGVSANETIQVLAIQQGGAKVFEDFVLSRVLLYDKLYNHQKVRAMEGAVVNALEVLRQNDTAFQALSTYVSLSDAQFLERRWPVGSKSNADEVRRAQQIVADVQRRNFIRAFAFGPEHITTPDVADESAQGTAWRKLSPLVSRDVTKEALAFRGRIRARAQSYLEKIGQPAIAAELHDSVLVIDLPDVQGIAKKTRCFVGDDNSGVRPFNEFFHVEKWSEAYENQKTTGYVFCPPNYALAVHFACRDIFREEFGLSFGDWAWSLTNLSIRELERFADLLKERGVNTLRAPVPERLVERERYLASQEAKAVVVEKYTDALEVLGERFATYQSGSDVKVTPHRIRNWLLQFSSDEIPLAVAALQQLRYWDRAALVDAFGIALEDMTSEISTAQWIPLGGATTSSHHLTYLWPDLKSPRKTPPNLLSSADQLQDGGEIVFYDDNVGSAGQSRTVLQQWFGVDSKSWIVTENHVQPLPPAKLDILRKTPMKFLFATGRRKGLEALLATAKELCGHNNVTGHIVFPEDVSCFQLAAGVFGDRTNTEKARQAFLGAGRKALSDKQQSWGDKKIDDRLLGYGNLGGLNVFYYNVPTATVTAIWKSSDVAGSEWMALFPRRPRD